MPGVFSHHCFFRSTLAIAIASSISCSTTGKPVIMLTAFEPFGKRGVNLSNDVASAIAQNKDLISRAAEVRICTLPVVYDVAAKKAITCYEEMTPKPSVVISMGEGTCHIRLETAATNLDDTPEMADNAGVTRKLSTIVPGARERLGFTLPVQEMYCQASKSSEENLSASRDTGQDPHPAPIMASITAGNYVCNNTAYWLARYFASKNVQFGFIHVPHSGCPTGVKDPAANGRIIAEMLGRAVQFNEEKVTASFNWPNTAPATDKDVEALLGALPRQPQSSVPACYHDFLGELASRYLPKVKVE